MPDYALIERFIKKTKANIKFRGSVAEYHYESDHIEFPEKERFVLGPGGISAYYYSLFHELMHFSERKVGWDKGPILAELRAEIGASYLSSRFGVPVVPLSLNLTHQKYCEQWIDLMKKDHALVFEIVKDALRGVNYLIGA